MQSGELPQAGEGQTDTDRNLLVCAVTLTFKPCLSVCASLIQWKCLDACSSCRAARHRMACQALDTSRPVGYTGASLLLCGMLYLTHQLAVEPVLSSTFEAVQHLLEMQVWRWRRNGVRCRAERWEVEFFRVGSDPVEFAYKAGSWVEGRFTLFL